MSSTHGAAHFSMCAYRHGRPEPVVAIELGVGARPNRERAQQEVEGLADRVRVRERTEVADSLAVLAAHDHRTRPLLVEGDREVRVRLVVLEPDVEPRLVPLDQVELEEERLDLVLGDDPLDVVGGLHHLVRALRQRRRRGEVVRQPAAQALRLPDVDHPALGVEELVRAGSVGDASGLRAGDHASHCRGSLPRRGSPRCYRGGTPARYPAQKIPLRGRQPRGVATGLSPAGQRAAPTPLRGGNRCCVSRLRCRTTTPSRPPTSSVSRIADGQTRARRPTRDPRPPLPTRRSDPLGRRRGRLVQARPLRRGQPPGDRHRVLRRALHGRVGRRAHRRRISA